MDSMYAILDGYIKNRDNVMYQPERQSSILFTMESTNTNTLLELVSILCFNSNHNLKHTSNRVIFEQDLLDVIEESENPYVGLYKLEPHFDRIELDSILAVGIDHHETYERMHIPMEYVFHDKDYYYLSPLVECDTNRYSDLRQEDAFFIKGKKIIPIKKYKVHFQFVKVTAENIIV